MTENIKVWTDALRSGNYQQGLGKLKARSRLGNQPIRYCCLGVGCELAGLPSVSADPETIDESAYLEKWMFSSGSSLPPPAFLDWLGVEYEKSEYDSSSEVNLRLDDEDVMGMYPSLAELNDEGLTFSQIADLIDYFGVRL